MSARMPMESGGMAVVRSSRSVAAMLRVAERRAIQLANRARVSRSSVIAAVLYLLVFVALVLVIPHHPAKVVRVDLPEQTRTIVLQEAVPLAPQAPQQVALERIQMQPSQMQEGMVSQPEAIPDRRMPRLDPDAGQEGRRRAEEATRALAAATRSLDKALGGLSTSLKSATTAGPDAQRASGAVRGGRADSDIKGGPALASSGVTASGSAVQGSRVVIEAPVAAEADGAGGSESVSLGEPPGVYRSNASLLGVIQRYAAGIQFCYETELKRKAHIGGKLVISITVAATGDVIEARVVSDGIGSSALSSCALTQIREWRFPAIPEGVTTFQTPFVFTPPN